MKNRNDYGFYSSGYIFDRLDRVALHALKKAYPQLKGKQIYTSFANINFYRQLGSLDKAKIYVGEITSVGEDEYNVGISIKNYSWEVAAAVIYFKELKN